MENLDWKLNSQKDIITIETEDTKILFENLSKFGINFDNVDFEILDCIMCFITK